MIRRAVLLVFLLVAAPASAFETQARAAYVYDVTTDTVLLEKDADTPLPPASMSKLMTLLMLFDALRDNPNVTLETEFQVSTKAREMGGSTMFLNELDRPTALDLIQGIVVSSGNDATVVVAEGLAGTEDAFAGLMNDRAKTIGMTNSTFTNASGWPAPNHRMSMRDLGVLATYIITEYPEYYGYFAQQEYDYKERSPANRFNRNPLLDLGIGADGLKTGHTQEAGYGLVGSAVQGDRRIVFVITGLESEPDRAEEAERIIAWAFRQFVERTLAHGGTILAEADVWMGDHQRIGLRVENDVSLLMPALVKDQVEAEIVVRAPLNAPIAEGDAVAELVIPRSGLTAARVPLVADRTVIRGGFVPRLRTASEVLIDRILGDAGELGQVFQ